MRKPPLIFVSGEVKEISRHTPASVTMGFPSTTIGGVVTAIDTNIHCFGDLVAPGIGDEELIAPLRVQVPSAILATIIILRIKDNGDPPLITDYDHYLCVLTGGGFQLFEEILTLNRIYYRFSTIIGSPTFLFSAGYGEE